MVFSLSQNKKRQESESRLVIFCIFFRRNLGQSTIIHPSLCLFCLTLSHTSSAPSPFSCSWERRVSTLCWKSWQWPHTLRTCWSFKPDPVVSSFGQAGRKTYSVVLNWLSSQAATVKILSHTIKKKTNLLQWLFLVTIPNILQVINVHFQWQQHVAMTLYIMRNELPYLTYTRALLYIQTFFLLVNKYQGSFPLSSKRQHYYQICRIKQ